MSGEERRIKIIKYLTNQSKPVSGSALAHEFGVSRQVIVQDVALLRKENAPIVSTNRGYVVLDKHKDQVVRIFKCRHSDEDTETELNCIVDLGGTIEDIFVNHKAYGRLRAEMNISSRRDVKEYISKIKSGKSRLLKNVTSDYHYHTVTAESEKILDEIEADLMKEGILIIPNKNSELA